MLTLLALALIAPGTALAGHPSYGTNHNHTRPSEVSVYVDVDLHDSSAHQRPPRSAYYYTPRPPRPPPPPAVVSGAELSRLVAAVDDATWSDDQVDLIRSLARGRHFTCAQVLRLVEPIAFSGDRLDAVRALSDSIVDPQNAYQLEAAFPFSSDRRALRRIL